MNRPPRTPDARRHTRRPARVEGSLTLEDGATFRGVVRDLSFGGAFLALKSPCITPGAQGTFKVHPGGDAEAIRFTCVVVRCGARGAGLKLTDTDFAGFERFKDLMRRLSPDPDLLLEEQRVSPGLRVATAEALKGALD